jgi:CHASE2 domain-containing sensor protein
MKKGLLLIFMLTLPLAFQVPPLEVMKLKTFDYLVPDQEPSGFFTILNISEDDVQKEGGWPLPRSRLAEINQQLINKGALGVGWVLSFIDKDRFGGDEKLAVSFNQFPIVVATFQSQNGIYPKPTGTGILGPDVSGYPLDGYIPNIDLIANNAFEGMVSAPVDIDNLVRRVPLLYQIPGGLVPSFYHLFVYGCDRHPDCKKRYFIGFYLHFSSRICDCSYIFLFELQKTI